MQSEPAFETRVLDGDILAILPRGEIDAIRAEAFNEQIQHQLDEGHSKIIIDCRHVANLSSVAVGSLIALQTRLRKRGGVVKLASLHGAAAAVIRLTHLDRVLDIYGDLEFARASFYAEGRDPQGEGNAADS